MILVAQHGLACPLELLTNLVFVVVIETVTLVAQPDAERNGEPEVMCLVEDLTGPVRRPGADRVRAGCRQLLERTRTAGPLDEIGFAPAQQLPPLLGRYKFDWYGLRHSAPSEQKGPRQKQGPREFTFLH